MDSAVGEVLDQPMTSISEQIFHTLAGGHVRLPRVAYRIRPSFPSNRYGQWTSKPSSLSEPACQPDHVGTNSGHRSRPHEVQVPDRPNVIRRFPNQDRGFVLPFVVFVSVQPEHDSCEEGTLPES